MLKDLSISAVAVVSSTEDSVELQEPEEQKISKRTLDEYTSDILEDHLFCIFLGYYASFNITPEKISEKQKGKFLDCSQVSLVMNKVENSPSNESIPLIQSGKASRRKASSKFSHTPPYHRMSRKKSRASKQQSRASKRTEAESIASKVEENLNQDLFLPVVPDIHFETNFDFLYQVTGENPIIMKYLKEGLTFDFLNENLYEGSISFNNQDGRGVYKWSDGSKYNGKFVGDFPHGNGCMEWADESKFDGFFSEGLRDGRGSYSVRTLSMNQTYTGSWCKGFQMGKGTLKLSEKNWYEGEFKNGLYNGRGMRQYPSGGKYLGDWKDGKQNGQGLMLFPNNDMYIGNWVDGKMEGTGKYVWDTFLNTQFVYPMHNTYIGQWKNSARHGIGSLVLSSGAVISTVWVDNLKHGWGKLLCTNGTTIESDPLFVNDSLVSLQNVKYGDDFLESSEKRNESYNTMDTWKMKYLDCILEPYRSCISPINIPPYFINIDVHLNKFFELSDWSKKIRIIDWCTWSLDMPYLCDTDKKSSDFEKVYEVGTNPVMNKPNEKDKNETIDVVTTVSNTEMANKNQEEKALKTDNKHCIKYITAKKKRSLMSRILSGMSRTKLEAGWKSNSLFRINKVESTSTLLSDKLSDWEIKAIYIFEKKWLRNTIIRHIATLKKLYYRYSTICCKEKPNFETGLLRVLLWKLLQDVNFRQSGFSIVELDQMAVGETDPFDFVPVCEMIHYLLILSWELYTKLNKLNKNIPGINAAGFDLFMTERVIPLVNKEEAYEPLFRNSDVLPIEALYRLFESLKPNLTLKKLIQRLTQKAERPHDNHFISLLPEPNLFFKHCLKGQNGILPGGEIIYMASKLPDFEYIIEEFREPPDVVDSVDIDFLGSLGIDTLIDTVVNCFPHLTNSKGEIMNHSYEICFLEFLDVLTECLNVYLLKMMKYSGDIFDVNNTEPVHKCLDQMMKEAKTEYSDMSKS